MLSMLGPSVPYLAALVECSLAACVQVTVYVSNDFDPTGDGHTSTSVSIVVGALKE